METFCFLSEPLRESLSICQGYDHLDPNFTQPCCIFGGPVSIWLASSLPATRTTKTSRPNPRPQPPLRKQTKHPPGKKQEACWLSHALSERNKKTRKTHPSILLPGPFFGKIPPNDLPHAAVPDPLKPATGRGKSIESPLGSPAAKARLSGPRRTSAKWPSWSSPLAETDKYVPPGWFF